MGQHLKTHSLSAMKLESGFASPWTTLYHKIMTICHRCQSMLLGSIKLKYRENDNVYCIETTGHNSLDFFEIKVNMICLPLVFVF